MCRVYLGVSACYCKTPSRPCDGVARRNRPLSMIGVDAPRKWFATSETASRGRGLESGSQRGRWVEPRRGGRCQWERPVRRLSLQVRPRMFLGLQNADMHEEQQQQQQHEGGRAEAFPPPTEAEGFRRREKGRKSHTLCQDAWLCSSSRRRGGGISRGRIRPQCLCSAGVALGGCAEQVVLSRFSGMDVDGQRSCLSRTRLFGTRRGSGCRGESTKCGAEDPSCL